MDKSAYFKVYICGPMSGIPEYNRPAFLEAEKALAGLGIPNNSPRLNGGKGEESNKPYTQLLKASIQQLLNSTTILLLEGWEKSWGATHELIIAVQCGYPVWITRRTAQGEFSFVPVEAKLVFEKIDWTMYEERQKTVPTLA